MKLVQLREKVRIRAGVSTGDQFVTPQVIDDAINQGILTIDGEYLWPWLLTTQTITCVAGQRNYTLPTNFRATRSVVITQPDTARNELVSISPTSSLSYPSSQVGAPEAFADLGDSLDLIPVPDFAYTVTHMYYRTSPELVNDGDSPLIPDQWHPAIVAAATANIAIREELRGLKSDADADVATWIRRMRNALRRQTGPVVPRVRPNGWI